MCTRVHTTGKTNTTPTTRNDGRDDGRRERERRGRDNPDEDREEEPKEKREADRKEKRRVRKKNYFCLHTKKNRNQIATTYTDAHRERATETGIELGNVKKMCSEESRALGMQRAARTEERG
jgi:hypothetical protein